MCNEFVCVCVCFKTVPHELKHSYDGHDKKNNWTAKKTTQFDITHFCLSENAFGENYVVELKEESEKIEGGREDWAGTSENEWDGEFGEEKKNRKKRERREEWRSGEEAKRKE